MPESHADSFVLWPVSRLCRAADQRSPRAHHVETSGRGHGAVRRPAISRASSQQERDDYTRIGSPAYSAACLFNPAPARPIAGTGFAVIRLRSNIARGLALPKVHASCVRSPDRDTGPTEGL